MAIAAITFDFWSTLFKDTPEIGGKRHTWRIEQMVKALAKTGWLGGYTEVFDAIEEVSMYSSEVRLKGGLDFTPEEQVKLILEHLDIVHGQEVFDETLSAYTQAAVMFPPLPLPGALETVREAAKRYPVGLISNTGITPGSVLRRILADSGIIDCFKTLTFSNEVNLVKPNPGIFLLTAQTLGVNIKDILHVGDDYEADCIGADRVGARAAWINPGRENKPAVFYSIGEIAELAEILRREAK